MKNIRRCKTCNSKNLRTILKDISKFDLKYDVVSCFDCGFRFRNIKLDKNEIERIYGEEYFVKEQKRFFFDTVDFKRDVSLEKLKLVNRFCKKKGKILDIGSGVGTFIRIAKDDNWKETGIEISRFATEHSKRQGLNVVNGDFSDIPKLKEKFDAVTLWHVIEHSEEPIDALRNVRKVIKSDSYVFIETITIDSLIFMLAEVLYKMSLGIIKWPLLRGYPIHHSNYYSKKTITRDIELAGFKVVELFSEPLENEFFVGGRFERLIFRLLNKLSTIFHKEIACIVIARTN